MVWWTPIRTLSSRLVLVKYYIYIYMDLYGPQHVVVRIVWQLHCFQHTFRVFSVFETVSQSACAVNFVWREPKTNKSTIFLCILYVSDFNFKYKLRTFELVIIYGHFRSCLCKRYLINHFCAYSKHFFSCIFLNLNCETKVRLNK